MKLQHKITMILATMIASLIILLTLSMYVTWYRSIQRQVAMDAMDQAVIIAENPNIKDSISDENGYIAVNKMVESIHLKTGIQYLYVLNGEGVYFAHPIPEKLNTHYDSEDIKLDPVQTKPTYYYEMTRNAMVEGYAPIYTDGIRSGTVIVGIYNGRILQTMSGFAMQLVVFAFIAIGIGIFVAYALSKNIKRSIYGLEPVEIAMLLKDREIILENIGEGLLAVNHLGEITMINSRAKSLLDQEDLEVGMPYSALVFSEFFGDYEALGDGNMEKEWRIGASKLLKIEWIALHDVDARLGWLFRIEDMSLLRKRAEELTNMQQLTQALRAQNHEFMNKLHTISGLIQLESYEDALQYIEKISVTRQAVIGILNEKVKVPFISGLVLAKYSKATERHIEFVIEPTSYLEAMPEHVIEDDVASIIGNLIDNAIDSIAGKSGARIGLSLNSDENGATFIIRDNGTGIKDLPIEKCFEKGVSTKGPDRGYGLYIVDEKLRRAGGRLTVVNDNGLVCTVFIPAIQEEV
ncbi:MAG: Spo0B domain-containing protein [Clostridiales bacterium]|nr:Spo0B domain-containing protein [Clostridiales bacterium]